MTKNSLAKYFGLTLVTVVMLSACNKEAGPIEDSATVLEKSITQAPKIYESNGDINVSFSNPDSKTSGEVKMTMTEKSNMENVDNINSEVAFDVKADINAPQTTADGSEKDGQLLIDAAANIKVIGDDLYASLTKLDLNGNLEGLEEAKAMLPVFVGPYMDKTVYLPMEKLMAISEQANAQLQAEGQQPFDYEAMKKYSAEQLPKDLADSKMLVVSEDHGIENVKSIGGDSISAYHYTIKIDPQGFETFMKKYNEQTKMIPEAEMALLFEEKEGQPGMNEVIEVLNEALNIEVWIGQSDYVVYKTELGTDAEKLKAAAEKIKEIDSTAQITEEDMAALEKLNLEVSAIVELSPLKSFKVEKPAQDDVIDLGPMLDMALQGAMNQLPAGTTPTDTMSEEDLQKMMEQMNNVQATPAQ